MPERMENQFISKELQKPFLYRPRNTTQYLQSSSSLDVAEIQYAQIIDYHLWRVRSWLLSWLHCVHSNKRGVKSALHSPQLQWTLLQATIVKK